jgi:hypothetical protein
MSLTHRAACRADLPAINDVIERAVMTWRLPERDESRDYTLRHWQKA